MVRDRYLITVITAAGLIVAGLAGSTQALATAGQPATVLTSQPPGHQQRCSAGQHTLAAPGSRVYPETGNGGYTSLHSDVRLIYRASTNRFLPGTHVTLTDRATQCLTSLSLDFERRSVNASAGPDMSVRAVWVDGRRASFRFEQPTYPGDPAGQDDPNPLAHQASELNPVGGPRHNPLPPACTPALTSQNPAKRNALNGTPCPANKLVITPPRRIRDGSVFAVTVAYTGRPGVHNDGDGTTEGWFRSDRPKGDGGFVTTEPVGTEDWMPLNDFPSAKPTYDFTDTVSRGKTVLANGMLVSRTRHRADAAFSRGSVTWHWHSAAPVASYLVEDSIGNYDLTQRNVDGIRFYEAQASSLSRAQKAKNLAIMNQQPGIVRFQQQFNGRYPFTSDGVVVGRPSASFEEEMETMITFAGGRIDADTLNHENMHQWWGDHVTEASYNLTFYKEGLATLGEFLFAAHNAEIRAGGAGTAAGRRAFQRSLVRQFDAIYRVGGRFWTGAPSDPTAFTLFDTSSTYDRPGISYIALRRILGSSRFDRALSQIQRRYGGRAITEAQLEAGFARWLPNRSAACTSRLGQFFRQWFDTAYPAGGGTHRPSITGPGLAGHGFYTSACTR